MTPEYPTEKALPFLSAEADSKHYPTMGNLSYTIKSAIADICDGGLDGRANNISIEFERQVTSDLSPIIASITIANDGFGVARKDMRSIATYSGGIAKGPNDYGKFQSGMKSASFSLGSRGLIMAKDADGLYKVEWDLTKIIPGGTGYPIRLSDGTDRDKEYFALKTNASPTGFLLRIDKLHPRVATQDFDALVGELKAHIGLTFQNFIEGKRDCPKINFTVNDGAVKAINPFSNAILRAKKTAIKYGSHRIGIETFHIPAAHTELPKNLLNQGIYLYRSGRLIAVVREEIAGYTPHNQYNGFRVYVSYNGHLDEVFKTDITKTHFDIQQDYAEKIWEVVGHYKKPPEVTYVPYGTKIKAVKPKDFKTIILKEKGEHWFNRFDSFKKDPKVDKKALMAIVLEARKRLAATEKWLTT